MSRNIYIPSRKRDDVGGGGTFIRNFVKYIGRTGGYGVVDAWEDCDIYFIAGASLASREEVENVKRAGKRIVLRVDNILADGANRNSGMSRMVDFAKMSDVVVYQSEWAKRLLRPLLGHGVVILNGVDTSIFFPEEREKGNQITVFYAKSSRNEGKRFHEVQYFWREYWNDERCNEWDRLAIVGKYADDIRFVDHPFEFHNGEKYTFFGNVDDVTMANVMRACDVAFLPYFADACPNTVMEAQACGLPVIYNPYGGTTEVAEYGTTSQLGRESAWDIVQEALRMRSIDCAKLYCDKYSMDGVISKWEALFDMLEQDCELIIEE